MIDFGDIGKASILQKIKSFCWKFFVDNLFDVLKNMDFVALKYVENWSRVLHEILPRIRDVPPSVVLKSTLDREGFPLGSARDEARGDRGFSLFFSDGILWQSLTGPLHFSEFYFYLGPRYF